MSRDDIPVSGRLLRSSEQAKQVFADRDNRNTMGKLKTARQILFVWMSSAYIMYGR